MDAHVDTCCEKASQKSQPHKNDDSHHSGGRQVSRFLKLAELFRKNRQPDRAVLALEKCIELFPDDFRAYFNLGTIVVSAGSGDGDDLFTNNRRAKELFVASYRCALAADDTSDNSPGANPEIRADICGSIAGVCLKLQEPAEALHWCETGLQKSSSPVDAHSFKACNTTCLFNYNVAQRQLNNIREALQFTWDVIDAKADGSYSHASVPNQDNYPASSSSSAQPPLTTLAFICVKWGHKYGADYVNNLYRSIHKSMRSICSSPATAISYQCYCLTDDPTGIDDSVLCLPFDGGDSSNCSLMGSWRGWWFKATLFNPCLLPPDDTNGDRGSERRYMCFFDLDTVICSDAIFRSIVEYVSSPQSSSGGTEAMVTLSPAGMLNEGGD
jgi:tetratricopeptide (TPR) repeat protein